MCSDSDMRHPFTFTPSVSLFVTCETEVEFGERFAALSDGGKVFMPPDDCGVGRRFGWVADRFGVSWQLLVPAK